MGEAPDRLGRGLLLAPLVFVAHCLEESAGFVSWFNGHVTRGITQDLFWTVNATGLVITCSSPWRIVPPGPASRARSWWRGSAS